MSSVKKSMLVPLSFLLYTLIIQSLCSNANDTLNHTQQLLVDQTLVSAKQIFEFGFFSLNGSTNMYLGLWYKNIPARRYLWVANRERPIAGNDSGSSLKFGPDGNLMLQDGKKNTVWSSNVSVQSNNTVGVLQDDGNFVLKDRASGLTLWESFDYPGDILLPGMKVGLNSETGKPLYLSSWKAENDPAVGNFLSGLSLDDQILEYFTWNGSIPYWRSGPWNGNAFQGVKGYANGLELRDFEFVTSNDSYIVILRLTPFGSHVFMNWKQEINQWVETWKGPANLCDVYGTCGAFGACNFTESPKICSCLNGFIPRSNEEWNKGDWRGGCVRRNPLLCQRNASNLVVKRSSEQNDGFQMVTGIKMPDHFSYLSDVNDADECKQRCLNNCSCVAYAYPEGIRCLIWTRDLIDSQFLSVKGDLFLRVAATDIPSRHKKHIKPTISITAAAFSGVIVLVSIFIFFIRWRKTQRGGRGKSGKASVLGDKVDTFRDTSHSQLQLSEDHTFGTSSTELPFIDFAKIVAFTDNFSQENKLGEGGFGPVYKGKTENGQHIAVKRLSRHSGQGKKEFKNEIILISKLQHRNLVRLLGCSIQGEEKLLVYEYMKNKSLDAFIFDSTKKLQLDWKKRFHIIQGIARGILYLHRDSCLRIIHRDLKASNVLLDDDMNPKISDFGLARTFKVKQELAKTDRVVGTFGYMSPEYAIWGQFSEKSDVYSFGVLLLEIVSGRKNTGFSMDKDYLSLLDYAWKLWEEQEGIDLLDQSMVKSSSKSEVLRCIQIGLLCVQDQPADRPTMFDVVLMLSSEKDIPQPKQPTFAPQKWLHSTNGSTPYLHSDDISLVEGR